MKKKIFVAIAILALAFSTAGCGGPLKESDMQIKTATLTVQESQIFKLMQKDYTQLFDYTVSSDVKSFSITCYKLDQNGKWVSSSTVSNCELNGPSGRIDISFKNLSDGMRIANQEGDNLSATEYSTDTLSDMPQGMSVTSFASDEKPIKIEYEKEIPLAIQAFSAGNGPISCELESFYNPKEYKLDGSETIYVLAIKFSKNEIN